VTRRWCISRLHKVDELIWYPLGGGTCALIGRCRVAGSVGRKKRRPASRSHPRHAGLILLVAAGAWKPCCASSIFASSRRLRSRLSIVFQHDAELGWFPVPTASRSSGSRIFNVGTTASPRDVELEANPFETKSFDSKSWRPCCSSATPSSGLRRRGAGPLHPSCAQGLPGGECPRRHSRLRTAQE